MDEGGSSGRASHLRKGKSRFWLPSSSLDVRRMAGDFACLAKSAWLSRRSNAPVERPVIAQAAPGGTEVTKSVSTCWVRATARQVTGRPSSGCRHSAPPAWTCNPSGRCRAGRALPVLAQANKDRLPPLAGVWSSSFARSVSGATLIAARASGPLADSYRRGGKAGLGGASFVMPR